MSSAAPVPTILITGFLGSGKTTFLNELVPRLRALGMRVAVLLNEMGEVAVDTWLVKETDHLAEVTRGSLFCACVRGDLVTAVRRITREVQPDVLVVEATGVADPGEMGGFGDHPDVVGLYRLSYSVCVASARWLYKVAQTLAAVRRQLALADLVVVTGSDMASEEDLVRTRSAAAQYAGDAPVVIAPFCLLPEPVWDGIVGAVRLTRADGAWAAPEEGWPVSVTPAAPLERASDLYGTRLLKATPPDGADALAYLMDLLPPGTERAKGLVNVDGEAKAFQFAVGEGKLVDVPLAVASAVGWVVAVGRYPQRVMFSVGL